MESLAGKVLLFSLVLITGCTAPVVTAYSPDAVTLKYDPAMQTFDVISEKAAELCARYGKNALLTNDETAYLLGHRYASFNCVD